jgi:hypothetical protein
MTAHLFANISFLLTGNRFEFVRRMVNDMTGAVAIATTPIGSGGVLDADDRIGQAQELVFTTADLDRAFASQRTRMSLSFRGDGAYRVRFDLQPDSEFVPGDLRWYKHLGVGNGVGGWATMSGRQVGQGWLNLQAVFATSDGVIYAVKPNGDLHWYKHPAWDDGLDGWAPGTGKKVGQGWLNFQGVFATSNGVIEPAEKSDKAG